MRTPTLATYTCMVAELGRYHAETLDSRRRSLEAAKANIASDIDALEKRTNQFIRDGWADLREWYTLPIRPFRGEYGRHAWDWHQYFRALCSDMQRPFIRVMHSYVDTSPTVLCIPKRKSLLPLSTSFLLLDQRIQRHDTITWRWVLTGEQFSWWCGAVTTDSEMRTALRTPLIIKRRN